MEIFPAAGTDSRLRAKELVTELHRIFLPRKDIIIASRFAKKSALGQAYGFARNRIARFTRHLTSCQGSGGFGLAHQSHRRLVESHVPAQGNAVERQAFCRSQSGNAPVNMCFVGFTIGRQSSTCGHFQTG